MSEQGGAALEPQTSAVPPVIDVREHPPGSCMALATSAFDALPEGGQFELVADHDFRGLFYLFKAERTGQFDWEPLETGPELWRARVRRTGFAR